MFYYTVQSSHWPATFEFKSKIKLEVGQCFRISTHDGSKKYPTRFKVLSVAYTPKYTGTIVEMLSVDTNVETF